MERLTHLAATSLLCLALAACGQDSAQTEPAGESAAPQASEAGADSTAEDPAPAPEPVPVDSDDDGVEDRADACPNTPPGTAVDARGCARDADGDRVTDADDQCPDTPTGVSVDSQGCASLDAEERFRLDLNFASGAAAPDRETISAALTEVVDAANLYRQAAIRVEGFTDDRGGEALNRRLSSRRAEAVAEVLRGMSGIDASRVESIGRGPADPIASNDTEQGRAENRRIEVVLVPAAASDRDD